MKYIVYTRVSTKLQSLGLYAQRTMVKNFLKPEDIIVAEFEEKESGKNDKRPELLKALELCKKENSTLLIAKLDRLSRSLSFISSMMDSGVEFVCTDMPSANRMMLQFMAVIAEHERVTISDRTKKALGELKAKGVKLGSPINNLTSEVRSKGLEVIKSKASNNENNIRAKAIIKLLKDKMTLQQIADHLNESGFKTSQGCEFGKMQVSRLIK